MKDEIKTEIDQRKVEMLHGYTLTSEVVNCGIGGKIWQIKVKKPNGNLLGIYTDETYWKVEYQARLGIFQHSASQALVWTPEIQKMIKEIESKKK